METTTKPVDAYVGEQVHILMWRDRIPQSRMCEALGVTRQSLHRKTRGEVKWSLDEVYAAASVLGVPVTDLLPERARGDSNSQHTGYYVRPHTYPPAVLIPAQRQPASRTVTP